MTQIHAAWAYSTRRREHKSHGRGAAGAKKVLHANARARCVRTSDRKRKKRHLSALHMEYPAHRSLCRMHTLAASMLTDCCFNFSSNKKCGQFLRGYIFCTKKVAVPRESAPRQPPTLAWRCVSSDVASKRPGDLKTCLSSEGPRCCRGCVRYFPFFLP